MIKEGRHFDTQRLNWKLAIIEELLTENDGLAKQQTYEPAIMLPYHNYKLY